MPYNDPPNNSTQGGYQAKIYRIRKGVVAVLNELEERAIWDHSLTIVQLRPFLDRIEQELYA